MDYLFQNQLMMMLNKLNNTLYIFCISLLFGDSPSFDFSYEGRYGDGKSTDSQGNIINENYLFDEQFLKINSSYKDYHLYLEFEYSDSPILGFSKQEFKDILSKYYLEKSSDKLYLKLGNIYALYGAGLGLYTFPDQNIDFDNSIEGFEFKYGLSEYIEPFVIYGSSNLEQRTNPAVIEPDRFSDNDVSIFGFNYNTPWVYGHILSKTQESVMDVATVQSFWIDEGNRTTLLDDYVGEQFVDASLIDVGAILNTEAVNLGLGGFISWLDFYFEGEWSDYMKLLGGDEKGHRYYLSLGTNIGDYGLSYEFKDYDMAYDILTFSAPPTATIESTSMLAARNSHSMNYGDEVGHQFEVVGPLFGELNFLGNLSMSSRHNNKIIQNSYASGLVDFISSSSFDGTVGQGEVAYLAQLQSDSNALVDILSVSSSSEASSPSFFDYMSFNTDFENFKSFYPYRQIYLEVSGYVHDNLYIKFGFDDYKEVIKYKKIITDDGSEEIQNGSTLFANHAQEVVQGYLDYYTQNPTYDAGGFNIGHTNSNDFSVLACESIFGDCDGDGVNNEAVISEQDFAEYVFFIENSESSSDYLSEFSLEDSGHISSFEESYEFVQAWTIPAQITLDLGQGNSINSYIEYQSKTVSQASGDNLYKGSYFSGSYTSKGFWTATLFYEREDIEFFSGFIKKGLWRGVDFSFDLGDKGQLSIFKGSQKGGRVCANGICADQPGFEDGVKVTYRTFL